jgi:prepilin-type N-terminal cleavage/methylation domain-containing protein
MRFASISRAIGRAASAVLVTKFREHLQSNFDWVLGFNKMAKRKLLSRFKRWWFSSRRGNSVKGFTLLELLVTTAIAAGIVAGLLFIVVQIMGVDQKEASKNETQREMQLALNYISTEMRDAVYVYTGATMAAQTGTTPPRNGQSLTDFLPANLLSANSVPVIAFWKQQPFPKRVKDLCASSPPADVACTNGSSYALVVYLLDTSNSNGTWKGKARITRYALTEFDDNGNRTAGYVNPGVYNNNFQTWPYGAGSSGIANLQTSRPGSAIPSALVDFVDDTANSSTQAQLCPNDPATTGEDYNISPPAAMLTETLADVRSFYACVNNRSTLGDTQDVLIYLRGNVVGRPGGFGNTSFLPTLETRVLSRGVLGRLPER